MAKGSKKVTFNTALLTQIAAATDANSFVYVSAEDGKPLKEAGYIDVNTTMLDPSDGNKAAARITPAGREALVAPQPAATASAGDTASAFQIITGAALPPSKRGNKGGGAPNKYPFGDLEVGGSFFIPVSAKHPEPAKSLGSAVSSANMKYAVETGEFKDAKRAVKGADGKPVLNEAGEKTYETVKRPVYKYERKFEIRPVEKGVAYGSWTAPENGALIGRVQ